MHATFIIAALAGFAIATPEPQNINFDLVNAAADRPHPTTAKKVTYDPSAVLLAAKPRITSSEEKSDSLDVVGKLGKRAACDPQPTGSSGAPATPNDAAGFLSSAELAAVANGASTPSGYTLEFSNRQASSNSFGYMGYSVLDSYDTASCARQCEDNGGCMSFNIFFQRNPSLEPAAACPNPAPVTYIKCVFWGGPVSLANANNKGEVRREFQVVIAGSNGYQSEALAEPSGPPANFTTPTSLGNRAIQAPYDEFGFNSFLGEVMFGDAPFDVNLCAEACDMKTQSNLANPPSDGTPVNTCNFFNTYLVYVNDLGDIRGQYCAMYSQSWDASVATNDGQFQGSDHYLITESFIASRRSDPGSACKECALAQAVKNIARFTLQPFCSSFLGLGVTTANATAANVPTSTPASLTRYPSDIVSSACSLGVTSIPSNNSATATVTVISSKQTSNSTSNGLVPTAPSTLSASAGRTSNLNSNVTGPSTSLTSSVPAASTSGFNSSSSVVVLPTSSIPSSSVGRTSSSTSNITSPSTSLASIAPATSTSSSSSSSSVVNLSSSSTSRVRATTGVLSSTSTSAGRSNSSSSATAPSTSSTTASGSTSSSSTNAGRPNSTSSPTSVPTSSSGSANAPARSVSTIPTVRTTKPGSSSTGPSTSSSTAARTTSTSSSSVASTASTSSTARTPSSASSNASRSTSSSSASRDPTSTTTLTVTPSSSNSSRAPTTSSSSAARTSPSSSSSRTPTTSSSSATVRSSGSSSSRAPTTSSSSAARTSSSSSSSISRSSFSSSTARTSGSSSSSSGTRTTPATNTLRTATSTSSTTRTSCTIPAESLLVDSNNCGACGNRCATGSTCYNGSCISRCAEGTAVQRCSFESFCASDATKCYCSGTTERAVSCIASAAYPSCSAATRCTASSQCGSNRVCVINSCCSFNICVALQTAGCPNRRAPRSIFRRREVSGEDAGPLPDSLPAFESEESGGSEQELADSLPSEQ